MRSISLNPTGKGIPAIYFNCPVDEAKISEEEAKKIEDTFEQKIKAIPLVERVALTRVIYNCHDRKLIFCWSSKLAALRYINRRRWPFFTYSGLYPFHVCFDHPTYRGLRWPIDHYVPSETEIEIPYSDIELFDFMFYGHGIPKKWVRI